MNREQFSALHYTAPGTDIIIGLPKNHLWEGAGSYNARGEKFMANMPTEEVFTAPDSHRVDGYISSTKPLSYAGTIISGMKFTFKDGKVIDFSAEQGEDVLAKLLDTDEGARRLEKSHLYLTLHLFLNLASSFSIHYLMKTHRIT